VLTLIDTELHKFLNLTFRYRPATSQPARLLVMIHGWTGNENSMWIFASRLPKQVAVLAPRGPYPAQEGGYTWREISPGTWGLPDIETLRQSAEILVGLIDDLSREQGLNVNKFGLIGFSQGAALAYTLLLLYPERITAVAALSGFLPEGAEEFLAKRPLEGKVIYIVHGRQDRVIPVERARRSVELLEDSGAQVKYCESDGGHKVSADCFSGLEDLF
jgi:phospholipase/carboxylesterase